MPGDFIALCTNPELAAEVTLQPIRRFGFDAAILFSDILMLPWALGYGLRFAEGEGPYCRACAKGGVSTRWIAAGSPEAIAPDPGDRAAGPCRRSMRARR